MTSATDDPPAATTELPLPDGAWNLDPQHSEIGFAVKDMWGLRTVRGRFTTYHGSLNVRAPDTVGELTIDAASIDTANHRRDQHLRSPAFFDVERHPQIVFTATALTTRQTGPTITGELTIGTSRVPLQIPIHITHMPDGALRLQAKTTVSRDAAGLAWNILGMIRGDATLHAQLTLKHTTT
jgi:polyisoprenoid-binding protein YceI